MFFYLICTVVTIDTIGAVASNGAQGFSWLIFLGVFFFYFLGGKTRRETAAEPVVPAYVPAESPENAL
jgi:hypothetical protein